MISEIVDISNQSVDQTRSHGNPQIRQTIYKAIGYSPQADRKALFLKETSILLIEDREVSLMPT